MFKKWPTEVRQPFSWNKNLIMETVSQPNDQNLDIQQNIGNITDITRWWTMLVQSRVITMKMHCLLILKGLLWFPMLVVPYHFLTTVMNPIWFYQYFSVTTFSLIGGENHCDCIFRWAYPILLGRCTRSSIIWLKPSINVARVTVIFNYLMLSMRIYRYVCKSIATLVFVYIESFHLHLS